MRAVGRVVLRATAAHVLAEAGRSPAVPERLRGAAPAGCRDASGVSRYRALRVRRTRSSGAWPRATSCDPGPATVWTRCRLPIVRDSALTGLERVLAVVDAANGISAVLPLSSWTFAPIDLMVTLQRLPDAEWVGLSSRSTIGSDGIGSTETVLFDADGVFGRALQTLYVAPRKPGDFV